MPLIVVSAGTPVIPAGTYPATLVGIAPKRMATKFSKPGTEDDFLEWTWLVEAPDKDVEITSLTSIATGPKSRIVEYLTALMGAERVAIGMGLDEKDLVGLEAQVQTIVTEDGFSKIDKIVGKAAARRPGTGEPRPVTVAPSIPVANEDDLPF